MAYCDLSDLVGYLNQFRDQASNDPDLVVLDACLVRAEAAVNEYLNTPTSLLRADATTRVIYGSGTQYLPLPSLAPDSVTDVTTITGYTVPDYIERDGFLITTTSDGIVSSTFPTYQGLSAFSAYAGVWQAGVPYTVSATFGWSATDMANLAQATLERAVQLWRFKDSGGSETVAAEGAITTVKTGWTPGTKQILDKIAARVRGFSGGVW